MGRWVLLLCVYAAVWVVAVVVVTVIEEWRIGRKMRREGHFLPWPELVGFLEDGNGVVIFNVGASRPGRCWWCPRGEWSEDSVDAVMMHRALLTNPPWKYRWSSQALQRDYPHVRVELTRASVFSD